MASTLHTRFKSSGFLPVEKPKILVNAAPVDNEEAFHHRIVGVCQTYIFWQSRRLSVQWHATRLQMKRSFIIIIIIIYPITAASRIYLKSS
jgi:hypothetical protein